MPSPVTRLLIMLTLVVGGIVPTAWGAGTPEPMDGCQVVARIGNQVVLSCELLWQVNLILEGKLDQIPPGEIEEVRSQLVQQYLNAMLDSKLLYADFRAKLPEASLPDIHNNLAEPFNKERVPQLMKQVGIEDRSELDARMRELGGSVEDVRQDFYQSMIAQSWMREAISVDDVVTHEQLLDYYREHATDYDYPAQARWEELMVRFRDFDSRDAAWAAIAAMGNEAFTQAANAPNAATPAFAEIAKAKSQGFTADEGGEHNWTTKNALAAETLDEALFSLQVGAMSPILQSQQGFHIVRVLERKTAGRKPFSEVQNKIQSKIVANRYNKGLEKKLGELRKTTQIWTIYGGTMTAEAYMTAYRDGTLQR